MCGGATSTQQTLQKEEADFYKTQIDAYNKAYANFSDIQDTLNKQFAPILAAGPGQMGYTPGELTALNTQAAEGTASYYQQAQRALAQNEATLGGGTSNINMTAGASADARARLAAAAAGQSAGQRLQITQQGYDIGRQQWMNAISGEEALAQGWNPNAFSGSATSAGQTASAQANQIAQQQQAAWGSVLGALGGIAGSATGNLSVGPFGRKK